MSVFGTGHHFMITVSWNLVELGSVMLVKVVVAGAAAMLMAAMVVCLTLWRSEGPCGQNAKYRKIGGVIEIAGCR
jgi:hypothetical protein